MPSTAAESRARNARNAQPAALPPPLVALAAWMLPGAGYWLIGHRARGVTVGVTVLLTFLAGLFIGGVRVLEVPFYDKLGRKVPSDLIAELRAKPWSIAQVMTGPAAIIGGGWSVWAAQPDPSKPPLDPSREPGPGNPRQPYGADSHARVNEIAVLYTAVAGMLNLLAIIDSSHRAGKMAEGT